MVTTAAILLGLGVTAIVALAQAAGWLERLELITLDWRFRYRWINPIRESGRITCIDIGDRDLETIGRWPWPRDQQAEILRVISELKPAAILVDITYVEPEEKRLASALGAGAGWSGETAFPETPDPGSDPLESAPAERVELVYPDLELAAAIAEAGNVYLAFHHPRTDLERSDGFNAAVDALQSGEVARARELIRRLELRRQRVRVATHSGQAPGEERPLERARLTALLEKEPDRRETALAEALGLSGEADRAFIDSAYPRCLAAALRRRVRSWLDQQPQRWQADAGRLLRPLFESISQQPFENITALRETLEIALREVLGVQATARNALLRQAPPGPAVAAVEAITPVYYLHARAARRCGLVNFEPDADGVMRRERLLVQHDGRIYTQLAFTVACDLLGVDPDQVTITARNIVLRAAGGTLELQLDSDGRVLVPWVPGSDYTRQFRHVRADAFYMVARYRAMYRHNAAVLRRTLAEILSDPRFDDAAQHAEQVQAIDALSAQAHAARLRGRRQDAEALEQMRASLEHSVRAREALRSQQIRQEYQRLAAGGDAADPAELQKLTAMMATLSDLEPFERANARIAEEIDAALARLRPAVQGQVCLLGYTATSLADMTPIPTHPRAPGVMAHANLLNGLLTGQLVRAAPGGAGLVLTALCGIGATLTSLLRRPRAAMLGVLGLAAAHALLAGWLSFRAWLLWVPLVAPVVAALLAYVSIAVFRYIFVEGERRQLATALAQYTSREIARQVAENPELCRRAESREVTAMFTDLRGFTGISERIGAERTQRVLNICLGRFSDVMLRHEAMINKFIGDGIFAFWNPVIYPQPDHALRACETAVDLFAALDDLRREQRQAGGDEVFEQLALRVGVATGPAIVGPCGSSQKYDYTCIGDSVNVAARLESANKFYGTRVLVSAAVREQVSDRFEFRPLGGVQVKGKQQAVQIFELLGRRGETPHPLREYAERFGQAVAHFQARRWNEALAAFEACLTTRPDDLAARQYAEAARAYRQSGPPDDWNGSLELKEK